MHKLTFGRSGRRKPIVPAWPKKVCVDQRKLSGYAIRCFKFGWSGRLKPIEPAWPKKVCVDQRKLNGLVIRCFKTMGLLAF